MFTKAYCVKALQRGFTLVELLIVAIILAILAAIVVPQFASTTGDAQVAALKSNLAAVRGAIDLYYQQHGSFPAFAASTGGTCTGGTAGSGAVATQAALNEQLTRYSNAAGQTCSRPVGTSFPFGPYLKGAQIPANPVTGSSTVLIVPAGDAAAGDLGMQATVASGGWRYDVVSGKFIANDNRTDSAGVRYDSY